MYVVTLKVVFDVEILLRSRQNIKIDISSYQNRELKKIVILRKP